MVFRLADGLPASALKESFGKIERFARCDRLLDAGVGRAVLKSPDAAQIVVDSLFYFDGQRYALLA